MLNRRMYRFLIGSILLILRVTAFAQPITTKVLHTPDQMGCTEAAPQLNQILFGAIPPDSDNKPVVVFVHGWFDNGYAWFMTKNDWYKRCYDAGYKTAFFFQSNNGTFQENGQVVADMVRQTCAHYHTSSVIAVCHSKGGYDMEWALYNSGVWDSVQGVITLSTPFWGAPMADLIASPGIRSALVMLPLVGPVFQGEGTYQMQPAYMAGIARPMLDNHPNNHPEKFHCFASWGYDHVLHIPEQINTDILMVVFPDYRPACADLPGFNKLAGDLMSGFMNITGQLSQYVGVQDAYENPAKDNAYYVDGLAPYYSSIRPGAFVFSEPPPAEMSRINHLDVLYAFEMWQYVQPQIEYCWQHPVLKTNETANNFQQYAAPAGEPVSGFRFVQGKTVEFTKGTNSDARIILVGAYSGSDLKIYEGNTLLKTIPLQYELEGIFDAFHEVDLKDLVDGHDYKIVCGRTMTALLDDGQAATLKIQTSQNNISYSGEAVSIKAIVENATEPISQLNVMGFLNRNMDAYGHVISDRTIPVSFEYDENEKAFVCKNIPPLAKGIYNVSVLADGNVTHRFATTSIGILGERQNYIQNGNLLLYPNPATDEVNISCTLKEDDQLTLAIYDFSGKLVLQQNMGKQYAGWMKSDISVEGLAAGTYILELRGNTYRARQMLSVF